jgi:hypothetical protein
MLFVQLQHQLEVTSNLCQSILLEQAQQQQQQHGNNLLAAVGAGNNLLPHWGFPPPPYPTTPHLQAHTVTAGKIQLAVTLYRALTDIDFFLDADKYDGNHSESVVIVVTMALVRMF